MKKLRRICSRCDKYFIYTAKFHKVCYPCQDKARRIAVIAREIAKKNATRRAKNALKGH